MVIFLIGVCLVLGGLIAWLGSGWAVLWVGVALLAGLAAYILCGLWMVRAPGKSLAFAAVCAILCPVENCAAGADCVGKKEARLGPDGTINAPRLGTVRAAL